MLDFSSSFGDSLIETVIVDTEEVHILLQEHRPTAVEDDEEEEERENDEVSSAVSQAITSLGEEQQAQDEAAAMAAINLPPSKEKQLANGSMLGDLQYSLEAGDADGFNVITSEPIADDFLDMQEIRAASQQQLGSEEFGNVTDEVVREQSIVGNQLKQSANSAEENLSLIQETSSDNELSDNVANVENSTTSYIDLQTGLIPEDQVTSNIISDTSAMDTSEEHLPIDQTRKGMEETSKPAEEPSKEVEGPPQQVEELDQGVEDTSEEVAASSQKTAETSQDITVSQESDTAQEAEVASQEKLELQAFDNEPVKPNESSQPEKTDDIAGSESMDNIESEVTDSGAVKKVTDKTEDKSAATSTVDSSDVTQDKVTVSESSVGTSSTLNAAGDVTGTITRGQNANVPLHNEPNSAVVNFRTRKR